MIDYADSAGRSIMVTAYHPTCHEVRNKLISHMKCMNAGGVAEIA